MIGDSNQVMQTKPINVLHYPTAADPFCVVWKAGGVPSAPLHEGDECALSLAIRECPALALVGTGAEHTVGATGNERAEHGLVHRLDTDTRGLLLIAASDAAYTALIEAQKRGQFKKTYRAQVECIEDNAAILGGFPPPPDKTPVISSRFRAWGPARKEVRPVTEDSGAKAQKAATKRVYHTAVQSITDNIVTVSITAGFRHQVRCHLAWMGLPVAGDRLYNSRSRGSSPSLQFECVALTFPHPLTGRIVTIDNNGTVI